MHKLEKRLTQLFKRVSVIWAFATLVVLILVVVSMTILAYSQFKKIGKLKDNNQSLSSELSSEESKNQELESKVSEKDYEIRLLEEEISMLESDIENLESEQSLSYQGSTYLSSASCGLKPFFYSSKPEGSAGYQHDQAFYNSGLKVWQDCVDSFN